MVNEAQTNQEEVAQEELAQVAQEEVAQGEVAQEEVKENLRGTARWSWASLRQANTAPEFQKVLADIFGKVGDGEVTVTLHIPGPAYVRIMGNAWLAKQYGEIEEINPQAYFDRALHVMEINLKNIAVRKRGA